ncbi:hypothetical protein K488DRAFT_70682 [Vararia minispora EC-137]|uniref:Uncharacterized protein n=1 Tax=Vararia minispora EC-137 TaxID=1314806 RepID=A0ACB8QKU7_9AGAM|nr:hypothetical protein K488DRAFT_70682 [Vararia minispora EC-137]
MRTMLLLFVILAFLTAVKAGCFNPRQHDGMLVAAAEHRTGTATRVYDSSKTVQDADNVISKLGDAIGDASTVTAAPVISTAPPIDTTPAPALNFNYMVTPIYAWGHSLLQKLLPVEWIPSLTGPRLINQSLEHLSLWL